MTLVVDEKNAVKAGFVWIFFFLSFVLFSSFLRVLDTVIPELEQQTTVTHTHTKVLCVSRLWKRQESSSWSEHTSYDIIFVYVYYLG